MSDVTPARFADVTVVGAGLTGSLVALALAERGAAVQLIEAPGVLAATAFSYAGVPWWSGPAGALGELQAGALRTWQALSLRHGDLGVESCSLALLPDVGEGPLAASHLTTLLPHGPEGTWIEAEALRALEPRLRPRQQSGALLLPYARVALERWSLGLRRALRRLRVHRLQGRVCQLMPVSAGPGTTPVQLRCTDGTLLSCRHVVLCQGASIPELLPSTWLPQLRHSWAGALDLPLADRWRGPLVMALRTLRRQLETSSLAQRTAAWSGPRETPRPADAVILDPGLAPCSAGVRLGQTSSLGLEPTPLQPPDPAQERRRLARVGELLLAEWGPKQLAMARLRQGPVSFTLDGRPLVGPMPRRPGVWVFSGFSGPFAQAVVLAPLLARALDSGRELDAALALQPWRPLMGEQG